MVCPRSKSRSPSVENCRSVMYTLLAIFRLYTVLCFCCLFCSARDSIQGNSLLIDEFGETLVSAQKRFELGFFTPDGALHNRRYVGIWYYKSNPQIVVWVANRDNPLRDSGGSFALSDGNLKVMNAMGESHWATNLPSSSATFVARLEDSGNLVLRDDHSPETLWESFEHPTDTFLNGMKMSEKISLISWKDKYDPGSGNFTFRAIHGREGQYVINSDVIKYWESVDVFLSPSSTVSVAITSMSQNFSNSSMSQNFSNSPEINKLHKSIDFSNATGNFNSSTTDSSNKRLVMNYTGKLQFWSLDGKQWSNPWWEPIDNCSLYHACGNYGSCNINKKQMCKCLPGYEPLSPDAWRSGDFLKGCAQKSSISCKDDEFINLEMMKVRSSDTQVVVHNETACRKKCLEHCQICLAFSFQAGKRARTDSICHIWQGDLYDLQEEYVGGQNISVRVASSVSGNNTGEPQLKHTGRNASRYLLVAIFSLGCVVILSSTTLFYVWRRKNAKRLGESRASTMEGPLSQLLDSESRVMELICLTEEEKKGICIPFFTLDSILFATNDFSGGNKLGQGGYGPVYRGKFAGAQEMAVKRLSKVSGQGFEEFKNEVVLIAKLQHRNLVRLLGYCVEGDEKILLYEYMPNKSLDLFLFDQKLSVLLDWERRYNIILGIARGLLYLHQDSRLRIIHRDLKTSNVLLDEDMNPKISDFGLARIVEGNQTESNTVRVVGTYGYMSPEYALDGAFSVKSDVFSFGVVVLEIISGRKNTGFYQSEHALSLIGHAWELWTEDNIFDLIDPALRESCRRNDFLKCANVGLLCVQEDPQDRPSMSNVVVMLTGEFTNFPTPKQPAFVIRRCQSGTASSSSKPETINVSTTTLLGR